MNSPKDVRDRRSERRIPCNFTFSVQRLAAPGGLASAVDLSPEGMRFQFTGRDISVAEKILVQFTVRRSTYSFCGVPVRVSTPEPFTQEVALCFQSVDPRTREHLRKDIARHLMG